MMKMIHNRGFTLIEFMIVILILGILFTALYMGSQPYLMRSRDTKRVADILGYTSILDTYDKNFDTFPSNRGLGGNPLVDGYCLSDFPISPDNPSIGNEGKFTSLGGSAGTSAPPRDPVGNAIAIPSPLLCAIPGSYVYSRMKYGTSNTDQIAIIAARLEMRTSGNYGTGADIIDTSKIPDIIAAKKSSIPDTAPDQLYLVFKLH